MIWLYAAGAVAMLCIGEHIAAGLVCLCAAAYLSVDYIWPEDSP